MRYYIDPLILRGRTRFVVIDQQPVTGIATEVLRFEIDKDNCQVGKETVMWAGPPKPAHARPV